MSISIITRPTPGMRPLADAEVHQVAGGNPVLAGVAAGLITWGIVYTATHGTMGDAVRNVLEQQKLR